MGILVKELRPQLFQKLKDVNLHDLVQELPSSFVLYEAEVVVRIVI